MNLNQLFESPQMCPECGGISFSDLILAEKKDACYYKVKAGAKVWPSAYASGRLVQCRKKGAANYGNKSESVAEGSEPQVGDAVYYGKRLVGWFKGYSEHGKIITEPNYEEMGDEYANRDVYWDPQDKITIKPEQGVAEEQELDEKWSQKYKSSINCANPKGFSQRAHCAGRNKNEDVAEGMKADELSRYCEELVAEKGWDAAYKHAKFMAQGATDPAWGSVLKYLDAMKDGVSEAKKQPPEAKYDDEYDAMVARVKRLAGLGPMKTVYDPARRQYRNMPTAQQPKK